MYTPSKEKVAPFDYENEPMCCAKMNVMCQKVPVFIKNGMGYKAK